MGSIGFGLPLEVGNKRKLARQGGTEREADSAAFYVKNNVPPTQSKYKLAENLL
jgi:hypothetical protein